MSKARAKEGCLPGCLIALLALGALVVAATVIFPQGITISIRGDVGPPSITVERSLSAEVSLDSYHPSAVQTFSLTARDAGRTQLSAYLSTPASGVRLTVLADDGGSLLAEVDSQARGLVNIAPSDDQASFLARRYLAVVQLIDAPETSPIDVKLAVHASAVVEGSSSTPQPSFTLPPDFELSLDAVGAFQTRDVCVIRATYRETVGLAAGASRRTLRLRLAGAAAPAPSGGMGHVIMGVTPESYELPSDGRVQVHGELRPLSRAIDWDLAGSAYGKRSGNWTYVADPTLSCKESTGCQVDVVLELAPWNYYDSQSSLASREPVTETVTIVVEVTDLLIDAPVVPDGAVATLTLVDGPTPFTP